MEDWEKFGDQKTESYFGEETKSDYFRDAGEAPKAKIKKEKNLNPTYITKRAFVVMLIISIVCSAAVGALAYAIAMSSFGGTTIDKSVKTTNYNLAKATGSELSIQEIIAKNENSVVAITTEALATDFWAGQYVTQGAGSGVIYSEDGYIITNNHVISGATSVKVTLHDDSEYDAKIIASDPQTDIAIIKIEMTGLSPITFGDMDKLCVGDLAIAIGNPLGTLSGTATEGIISALEREITIDNKRMTLIQTSALINPGNSGGGLFDQYGNLIGITVAKSGGSNVEGLGFAIPCSKVEQIAKSLVENGYVVGRPAAGITIVDLTNANDAMQNGVSITGVYIKEVNGKNAKKAGLKPGDMVYYIDDVKVTGGAMLVQQIQNHNVGDKVKFTIVRDNEILQKTVTLEDSNKIPSGVDTQPKNS